MSYSISTEGLNSGFKYGVSVCIHPIEGTADAAIPLEDTVYIDGKIFLLGVFPKPEYCELVVFMPQVSLIGS